MVWKPKSQAIIHTPAEALDEYGNLRIGGGCPSSRRMMMAAEGVVSSYTQQFVVFDGTNDYMTRGAGLTGSADAKKLIVVFTLTFQSGDGTTQYIYESTPGNFISRDNSGKLRFFFYNSSAALKLRLDSTTNLVVADGKLNILMSADVTGADTDLTHLWINDIDVKNDLTLTDDTLDFTNTNHSIGARAASGTLKLNAHVADFYMNFGEYLDFSVESNRRKFFDGDGNAVDLGADGSLPTDSQPIIYFRGPAASFPTNLGSDGDTWDVTGALTDA